MINIQENIKDYLIILKNESTHKNLIRLLELNIN